MMTLLKLYLFTSLGVDFGFWPHHPKKSRDVSFLFNPYLEIEFSKAIGLNPPPPPPPPNTNIIDIWMIGNGHRLFGSVSQIFMFHEVQTHIERFILIVSIQLCVSVILSLT